MQTFLPTVTVEIGVKVESDRDSFGDVQFDWVYETLTGCVVVPYNSPERAAPFDRLDKTTIQVFIPSSFTKSLNNARLQYRDKTFEAVTNPIPYSFSPLPWDRDLIFQEVLFGG
jgi:hypothetical protein